MQILKAGFGYFDVSHFGYGNDFKRAAEDMAVTVIGAGTRADEVKVKFADGRIGFTPKRAVVEVAQ